MKDSLDVQRAITQTIKLHLNIAGLDSSEKRQILISSTSYQDQDIYLTLDGIGLRLCPAEIECDPRM